MPSENSDFKYRLWLAGGKTAGSTLLLNQGTENPAVHIKATSDTHDNLPPPLLISLSLTSMSPGRSQQVQSGCGELFNSSDIFLRVSAGPNVIDLTFQRDVQQCPRAWLPANLLRLCPPSPCLFQWRWRWPVSEMHHFKQLTFIDLRLSADETQSRTPRVREGKQTNKHNLDCFGSRRRRR